MLIKIKCAEGGEICLLAKEGAGRKLGVKIKLPEEKAKYREMINLSEKRKDTYTFIDGKKFIYSFCAAKENFEMLQELIKKLKK